MRVSFATLLLIPATYAIAIPVSDTVSSIADTAAVLANPSIVSPIQKENTHISRDVSNTAKEIQSRDVNLESVQELAAALTGRSIIAGRDLADDLNGILDEIDSIKKDLDHTLAEANDQVRKSVKEIVFQLTGVYTTFIQRVKEILDGPDKSVKVSQNVGKTTEEIQSRNDDEDQGQLGFLINLTKLTGEEIDSQLKEIAEVASEEVNKQITELRARLNAIKVEIAKAINKILKNAEETA